MLKKNLANNDPMNIPGYFDTEMQGIDSSMD